MSLFQVIKTAEKFDSDKRASEVAVKKLQEEKAELVMWKKQSIDRYVGSVGSLDGDLLAATNLVYI